jgi:hypothetical protein
MRWRVAKERCSPGGVVTQSETTKNQPTKLRRSRIGAATSKLSRKPSKKLRTTPGLSCGQSPVVTRTYQIIVGDGGRTSQRA